MRRQHIVQERRMKLEVQQEAGQETGQKTRQGQSSQKESKTNSPKSEIAQQEDLLSEEISGSNPV